MTVQVSNITEYVDYLEQSIVCPESVVVGKSFNCYLHNDNVMEWVGNGDQPVVVLACNFTENEDTTQYIITSVGGVMYSSTGNSSNMIGYLNNLIRSNTQTLTDCIMWSSSYSQTGSYSITFTIESEQGIINITKNVTVVKDIIATATTTVKNGISTTGVEVLKPYSVYRAMYLYGKVWCYDVNFSYDVDPSLVENEWGWNDMDELLFYVYPTSNIQTLYNDIEGEGCAIDPDNGISYVPDDDLKFVNGNCTVLVSYIAGMGFPEYDDTSIYLNGKEYIWSLSYEMVTQSSLIYLNGHTSNDFVAGQTYQITARYLENDGYELSENIGQLEILKYSTTTTISGSSSVTIGENLTLSIVVKENNNNTTLTNGYITVYDGTDIVQQNYAITGNSTQITFTPSTTGTHNIYAIFTDSGTTYNTSRSNTLTVTVNKKPSTITTNVNSIETTSGEQKTITGTLTTNGTGISGANITVSDSNNNVLMTVTTDSNGDFTFNYTLENLNDYNNNLSVEYNGTNIISASSKSIQILPYQGMIYDLCNSLNNWNVTDTGHSAYINSQTDIQCVRPPTTSYQRVYWKYPLKRGTDSSIKFKVYIKTNANGIILGTMEKYGQDHMTSVKSWWGGLGSSNNWTDGPVNSQNRHGGARMSYNTWHTIEFELEDNLLHTYVDNVSVRDYTIPNSLSSNSYFNDYFFLGFSGNGVWIRDIEYESNTTISDDTLNSIRNAHLSQF